MKGTLVRGNWKEIEEILIYSKKGICVVGYNWNISFM